MDPQSFIQSGLLEAYALGQCSAAERLDVERMVAAYPEVRAELDAIEQSLEKVALASAVPPPPALKAQIMDHIRRDTAVSHRLPGMRLPPATGWMLAGGLLLALALLFYRFRTGEERLNNQIRALHTEVADCREQSRQQEKERQLIALLRDRDTRSVVLTDGPAVKVSAVVWHNPKRQETALDINSLPVPGSGQYFQFWAIVDGKPVSMGMVNRERDTSWQELPFIPNAQAFAISAESKPNGSPTPTLVLMAGKV